jgi:hypothetical protein
MKPIHIYYNELYVPFFLYLDIVYIVLSDELKYNVTKHYNNENIRYINFNTDETIILYFNYIPKLVEIYGYDFLGNSNVIFIHADNHQNHSQDHQNKMHEFCRINQEKIKIWDYCSKNIKYYRENFPNLKYYYIPLFYHPYLEEIYEDLVERKIPYDEKDIDILFLGRSTDRRRQIFFEINKKYPQYKLVLIDGNNSLSSLLNIIEKSKIIINPYANETVTTFDYYRLALLYPTKKFVINEEFRSIDYDIEPNLRELRPLIEEVPTEQFVDKVHEFFIKSLEEKQIQANSIYDIYKETKLSNTIKNAII